MERERARRMTTESQGTDAAEAPAAAAAREPDWSEWAGPEGELGRYVQAESRKTLKAWAIQPNFLPDQAGLEREIEEGGYQHRQIIELLQNSADSLSRSDGSRIEAQLTDDYLYFADDGTALTTEGLTSLMHAYSSPKQDTDEIGRFGLGFKSLLAISSTIYFFSKSVSLRFDREWSRNLISERLPDFESNQLPSMRLADPIDARQVSADDHQLGTLCAWATNVVRVKLDADKHARNVLEQLETLPSELLLLIDHVNTINIYDVPSERLWQHSVTVKDGIWNLRTGDEEKSWKVFKRRRHADADEIRWAVPIGRREPDSKFWAYFETQVPCLVSGIVNARWRTGADRSNLVEDNEFNKALVLEAARLIADSLHRLSTATDPAGHLDTLPRQPVSGEAEYTADLRTAVFRELQTRDVVPDGKSALCSAASLKYPPRDLAALRYRDALKRWNESQHAPAGWLHPSAMTRERLSAVGMMFPTQSGTLEGADILPQRPLDEWLEALTKGKSGDDAVAASRDAIHVAGMLNEPMRLEGGQLGRIVLTRGNQWRTLDEVYLPPKSGTKYGDAEKLVHDGLVEGPETLDALKMLGVKELSAKERFRDVFASYLHRNPYRSDSDDCEDLWQAVSETDWADVVEVVKEVQDYRSRFPVRVSDGGWKPLKDAILPGMVCSIEEAPEVCVDTEFHSEDDIEILDSLGVWDRPRRNADITGEPGYGDYVGNNGVLHSQYKADINAAVHHRLVDINRRSSVGPLSVMNSLPNTAKFKYTASLLQIEDLFRSWTVRHDDWGKYQAKSYDSYSLYFVRQHGVVSDGEGGVVRLSEAGEHPSALRELAELPTWDKIKEAFGFEEPPATVDDCEAVEPEDEELIIDAWPGLQSKIRADDHALEVVRCSGITVRGVLDPKRPYFADDRRAYVVRSDGRQELESVNDALGLKLSAADISQVLEYEDRQVDARRRQVRECATDAERLLAAVGEKNLLTELPTDFRTFNRYSGERLEGILVADAAIANWQTDALWRCRRYLAHLDPPKQWAGGRRILEFVESLGFGPAWARERSFTLPPYEDVRGPFTLPDLHHYQQLIVDEVRSMLSSNGSGLVARRGLISLPTGAGKTRVTVQAVVEAMRDDAFAGDVLWVADREELCEQAIDAWQEVWRCIGPERRDLRISRLYAGRDAPIRIDDTHVVVASIQTLNARLGRGETSDYDTVRNVGLVVLDEAHHAIAPTYTRLMDNLGFQLRDSSRGPVMLGLTATPYRGRNEEETDRLAGRFYRNRLDRKALEEIVADDPEAVIRYLQSSEMQVLAKARHRVIDGVELVLTADERRQSEDLPWLPRTAEERLAENAERTDQILKAYEEIVAQRSERWPTLIFATSVSHAQTVAAVLNQRGISARWVSADTQPQTRRRYVEEYREGKIDVLVNYGVFREGFDAPKTRVVIVARPVYSPNLYFQMIGRGLRGPKNGGNENCLIIDVRDNILQFEKQLAFTELEDFWD